MAVNTKAIKRRMKSVSNTKKITKAMEMVSAAKMRRAVEAALKTRTYATLAKELLDHLSTIETSNVPLLAVRPVNNILLIMVNSNRGLCGSFNTNVFKKVVSVLKDRPKLAKTGNAEIDAVANAMPEIDVVGLGKKSALFAKKLNLPLTAVFDTISDRPVFEELLPVAKLAMTGFTEKKYDKILIAYTNYRSSLAQDPIVRQVLPVTPLTIEQMLAETGAESHAVDVKVESLDEFLFEPTKDVVLQTILPRLVEMQLFQSVLESAASEHSARMVAMKNATEAAKDMLSELQLSYNKARQAAITQEISEIVGGAAALE